MATPPAQDLPGTHRAPDEALPEPEPAPATGEAAGATSGAWTAVVPPAEAERPDTQAERPDTDAERPARDTEAPTRDTEAPAALPGRPTARTRRTRAPEFRPTRISGTWAAVIVAAVVLIFLLIFILQNMTTATVNLLGFSLSMPLGVAMLFAAIAGAILVALVGTARILQLRRYAKRLGTVDRPR